MIADQTITRVITNYLFETDISGDLIARLGLHAPRGHAKIQRSLGRMQSFWGHCLQYKPNGK